MEFEEWLDGVKSLALREFAGGDFALRQLGVRETRELVRSDPEARAMAEESWRVEEAARALAARQDYWEARDLKLRHGLV